MPTLGRIRATRQDDCPTRCGPHPDHGNGLAGEPRLGPSVTLAPVWGVPSSQAASLWRSERNLAMRRGGGRARGGATQEPQQPQGFVPHPSRFVPPSPASQDFWSRAPGMWQAAILARSAGHADASGNVVREDLGELVVSSRPGPADDVRYEALTRASASHVSRVIPGYPGFQNF